MAYMRLAESYYPLSELVRAAETARKAYELRDRTKRGKGWGFPPFTSLSHWELERARTSAELWAQTYPRNEDPQVIFWLLYFRWEIIRTPIRRLKSRSG